MGFNLSDKIQSLNDAMTPDMEAKTNSNRVSAFGGEASGFAKGVAEL